MTPGNVCLLSFPAFGDADGWLTPLESGKNVPFDIRRVYYIFGTSPEVVRGKHAHRTLKQLLVAVSGQIDITCEYGGQTATYCLDGPTSGLVIEGLVWHTMQNFSENSVLMVLASDHYDERDYIRDYQVFLEEEKKCR